MKVSGFRAMWVFVLFDLPVMTKRQKKDARDFQQALVRDGYWRLQYSVYARPCPSEENAAVHVQRARMHLPPGGQVRLLTITDRQFGRMLVFEEKRSKQVEQMPNQLQFF